GVARGDAGLEEREALLLPPREPRGQAVVAREVEVDDAVGPGPALAPPRGRGLHEAPGNLARLGEQEQADLLDVRARRDVDEVALVLDAPRIATGPVGERLEHALEVPGIGER